MSLRVLPFLVANLIATAVVLAESDTTSFLLRPAAVFDGDLLHSGWVVLVTGDKIAAAGPAARRSLPRRPHKQSICLTTPSFLE